MIIVTGAAGFIGSCIVQEFNNAGKEDIIIVDHLGTSDKWRNLVNLKYKDYYDKGFFIDNLNAIASGAELIIHMGACSSTTEKDADYLMENNFRYSKVLFDWCTRNKVRFIYASSAATYGNGSLGYDDSVTDDLKPLNMYGYTKKLFDQYVLSSKPEPLQVVGLRFFNVYGPNEYHKATMSSVIFHSFNQVTNDGRINLFKSYKEGIGDGEQKRDFIYVKDVCSVVLFMFKNKNINGIFNVGTGNARSFKDLAGSVFKALKKKPIINFIDMPPGLKEKYQYFTEANIAKLRKSGYKKDFFSLEEGIKDYVCNYLAKEYKCL